MIAQTHSVQSHFLATTILLPHSQHVQYAIESYGFAHALRTSGLAHDVHNVDVEMVVRRLIVQVQFQFIALKPLNAAEGSTWAVEFGRGIENDGTHGGQPGEVADAQVSERPDVPAIGDGEEMQGGQRAPVPV